MAAARARAAATEPSCRARRRHQIVLARHLVIHPRGQIICPRNIGRRQMKLLHSGRDSSVPGQRDVPGALQYGPGRRTRAARTTMPSKLGSLSRARTHT